MIESLDIRTLVVVLILGHAIAAVLLFVDTRKRAIYYNRIFMMGMALQSLAWLFIFLRGAIPDIISFELGNSLIFAGMCLEGVSLLSLVREIDRNWRLFFVSVLAVILVIWWLPGPGQYLKMGAAGFLVPFFFIFPALFMVFSAPRPSALQKFIGGTLILYIAATLFRGVYILVAGSYSLTIPSFYQVLFLLVQILAMILVSTGYILIRKEFVTEALEQDIAGRKRVEEKLRQSEEKYRKLFEQSNDAIFIADAGTRKITDCNRKAEVLMGYPRDVLLGMQADDLHPEDLRDETMDRFQKYLSGQATSIETEVLTHDGRRVPVSINAGPIEIEGTVFLIGVFRDITWQKEIEREIRLRTEEIDQFFHSSLDLFCIADTEGYFRRLNPEWEKTLGYTLAELEGKKFLDYVHPDDLPDTLAAMADLGSRKNVLNFINRYRHRDGTWRWIEWRSYPKGDRIFAAARDITRHYLEEYYSAGMGELKQELLIAAPLEQKLKKITDACVSLFGADFARIWITGPGDLCEHGCIHTRVTEGPDACRDRTSCLHLMVSSGRYTHTDGSHRRVPVGAYKIGRIASGEDARFITGDVAHDPRVHDHAWAESLGLVSFAGFQLTSSEGKPIGVLAFFSRQPVLSEMTKFLDDLATTTSQVILTAAAEEALQEAEKKYRTLVDNSESIIYSITPGGVFTFVSPSWKKFLGHDYDEVAGHDFREFVHRDDVPLCEEFLKNTLEMRASQRGAEYRIIHKDGSVRWHRSVVIPVFAGDGPVTSFVGNAVDFTDRKLAEEALRESEEKYRAIIENIQDMVYRADMAGKFTMVSPSGARLVGVASPDLLVGRDVADRYKDPEDRKKFLEALKKNGSVYGYPIDLKSADGTIRHVTVSSHYFYNADGEVQGIEGVIHDVTDLRRAEEGLRTANKKLNLLSSITRHDIMNQLMVLKGFLQLSEQFTGDREKISAYISRERNVVDTIERQIGFTRDYENMGVSAPSWQGVEACMEKAVAALPMRNVRVMMEIPGLEVYADPLLEKVFYNLTDNALRYGGDGLTMLRLSCRESEETLIITFEDDGAGVTADEKERIFSRGFGKNTGLGLFLVREILGISGITITESGEPGKGARFEMAVPKGAYRFTAKNSPA